MTPDTEHQIAQFQSYLTHDAGNSLLRIELGDLYHHAGQFDLALEQYQACLALAPEHTIARSRSAGVYISKGQFSQAEAILTELVAQGDTSVALQHTLGFAIYNQLRWEEARACFTRAIEGGLDHPLTHAYLAKCLHQLGHIDAAIVAMQASLALAPELENLIYLARLHLDRGDSVAGAALATQVLARVPGHPEANAIVGMDQLEKNDIALAKHHFASALSGEQNNALAWLGMALIDLREQRLGPAIDALHVAISANPNNLGNRVTLGWAQLCAGEFALAEAIFEAALVIDRNFAESYGGLATALALQQRFEEAEQQIGLAKRLSPRSFGADMARSIILDARGEHEAAGALIGKALKRSPREGSPALIARLQAMAARSAAKQTVH